MCPDSRREAGPARGLNFPQYRGRAYILPSHEPARMSATATAQGDWEGIRYVFYVTAGWLTVTALAVAFLMLVVPSMI